MAKEFTLNRFLIFLIPSVIGIFLFLTPLTNDAGEVTLPVATTADWLLNLLGGAVEPTIVVILVASAMVSTIATVVKPKAIADSSFWNSIFMVSPVWLVIRILGAVFAILVLFSVGPEWVSSDYTGGVLLFELLPFLFAIFLFAGLFLPLLLNFGLMELMGAILRNIMRPLFRLPGRASIDTIASWIGDGTVGIMLSNQQYETGKYTQRESAIVASAFSIVSITFSIFILGELNLSHMFWPFFLTVFVAGVVAAFILPRIPPLSHKANTYIDGSEGTVEPKDPHVFKNGFAAALNRADESRSVKPHVLGGTKNVLDLWFAVMPVVMTLGTLAAIVAEYTPVFEYLGAPFVPVLEWMQVPEADLAGQTVLIGFADMLLPTVLAGSLGITSEITLFIIACLSVSQLIYMSETGGVLIASKIPVSFWDCAVLFLIRTIITLPIIVAMAHLFY
ncbi:YjiH family protein [Shouchella shacheensis]|uniref:YjiH family protein n=1 Tax=Shouchella shacheensis TaxID=1649580 RepID=UPI00073FD810|nr:YjiH family protein [Shouchella shacheensis]